jgi:hypothetical protein
LRRFLALKPTPPTKSAPPSTKFWGVTSFHIVAAKNFLGTDIDKKTSAGKKKREKYK